MSRSDKNSRIKKSKILKESQKQAYLKRAKEISDKLNCKTPEVFEFLKKKLKAS